jgi:peroxiredoxin family protein
VDTTKKTIILFSGDFDKVMAAFIIANGAAAMGDDVTMFFTFWGLNVLRRPEKVKTAGKKSTLQAMFGKMMPKGTGRLGLSKMNFAGMGAPLMKRVMRGANAMSLEDLVASAREQGVKFVACTLSMDILGFKEEEMIPGLEYAGVASYLGEADEANVNLFI